MHAKLEVNKLRFIKVNCKLKNNWVWKSGSVVYEFCNGQREINVVSVQRIKQQKVSQVGEGANTPWLWAGGVSSLGTLANACTA